LGQESIPPKVENVGEGAEAAVGRAEDEHGYRCPSPTPAKPGEHQAGIGVERRQQDQVGRVAEPDPSIQFTRRAALDGVAERMRMLHDLSAMSLSDDEELYAHARGVYPLHARLGSQREAPREQAG